MDILIEKLAQIPDVIIPFLPKIILALVIFFIGKYILSKLMKLAKIAALKIPNIDKTLTSFLFQQSILLVWQQS